MAVDDYFDSEVGIAVAATATLLSPKARRYLRRGLVYGVAGVLAAGEAVAGAARRIGSDAQALSAAAAEEPRGVAQSGARARRSASSRTAEATGP